MYVRVCVCARACTGVYVFIYFDLKKKPTNLYLRCAAYVKGDLYLYVWRRVRVCVCTCVYIETSKCNLYPRILRCATYVKIDVYMCVCMWFSVCVCTCMYCDLVKRPTFLYLRFAKYVHRDLYFSPLFGGSFLNIGFFICPFFSNHWSTSDPSLTCVN